MKCPKDANTGNQPHNTLQCDKRTKCGWYCLRPENHAGDCHAHEGNSEKCLAVFNENECKGINQRDICSSCKKTDNGCEWKNILALIKLLED